MWIPDYSGSTMFDFIKNLFKSDSVNEEVVTKSNTLVAPVSGKAIPLSEVPDPVFAEKLAGDGMAIIAEGDTIVAPADGEVTLIFKTKHAFAMTLENGLELLIHIGLETVSLDGEGFEQLVEQGVNVKAGTPLIKINRDFILSKGLSLATPVLITNVDATKSITPIESGDVVVGKTVVVNFEV
ncbi:PTS system, glucose subfamily, IIA component [Clostridium sartagoforme AAU1]|uniref:PTS system, glucose subfamily, IIA component n=2 Tax=Clostridium sartagoforme TaxID=84031 RepID=R9C559_9CLOT|nr:PTS system, glucose subfamily, IIA component [Clostridium sartagoforme AAU1]